MSHIHNVIDTDVHYKIDGVTRTITNINETKRELVQNDHNSERLTFDMPRFIDGHDLSECNSVQIHYVNLDRFQKSKIFGVYEVDDLHVKSDDENAVALSWLVSGHSTQYVGTLNFSIRFACVRDNVVQYVWNTTVFKGISILEAIYNSFEIVSELIDPLEDIKADIADKVLSNISADIISGHYQNLTINGVSYNGSQPVTLNIQGSKTASGHWIDPGTIDCGFRPDVVFITEYEESNLEADDYCSTSARVWCTEHPWRGDDGAVLLVATDTGFTVTNDGDQIFDATDNIYHFLAVKFG